MNEQETIADIIAEMKREAAKIFPALPIAVLQLATRIEAAHRREREVTKSPENVNSGAASDTAGNCAKLREALELMNDLFERGVICTSYANSAEEMEQIEELYRKTKSALDAPPRNCDKYATADEALKAQEQMYNDSNFANGECKLGCPECDNPHVGCKIAWLFAPATEQKGKSDGK